MDASLPCGPTSTCVDEGEEHIGAEQHEESSGSSSESPSEDEDDERSSGAEDDSSSESEAPELAVDQHGRVVAQIPRTCFRFRSFSGVFSKEIAPLLVADCCAAARSVQDVRSESEYSEGQTFWIGAGDTPRCCLEKIALDIFRLHTGVEGCTFDAARSGAEWWCLAMDAESSQVAWHWDKDYSLEQSGINISPHLATVTYLSDVGAPTVMMDKTCSTDYTADLTGDAHTAFLSRPAFGKHVSFDGRFLHAAPGELSLWADDENGDKSQRNQPDERSTAATTQPAQRVSFLVNLWLNWKPRDAVRCPETVLSDLSMSAVPADFSNELLCIPTAYFPTGTVVTVDDAQDKVDHKAAAESTDDKDADALKWEFEAGKQVAVLTLKAPLSAIRDLGADCGASMLLHTRQCDGAADMSLIKVKATQRKKRKRGEEKTQ